jgi:hypothetical protein
MYVDLLKKSKDKVRTVKKKPNPERVVCGKKNLSQIIIMILVNEQYLNQPQASSMRHTVLIINDNNTHC